MSDPTSLSAAAAAAAVHAGELDPRELFAAYRDRAGADELNAFTWVADEPPEPDGADPRTSVVDSDCRVHSVRNLFVAGSAVFPTSGQANPTLTLIALSLRLGTHLAHRLETAS